MASQSGQFGESVEINVASLHGSGKTNFIRQIINYSDDERSALVASLSNYSGPQTVQLRFNSPVRSHSRNGPKTLPTRST